MAAPSSGANQVQNTVNPVGTGDSNHHSPEKWRVGACDGKHSLPCVLMSVVAFFFFACIMLVAFDQADFTETSDYDFFLLDREEVQNVQAVDRAIAQLTNGGDGATLTQPQQSVDPPSLDVLVLARGESSDLMQNVDGRGEVPSLLGKLLLDADFPQTCHVLNQTSRVCEAPLTPVAIDYDSETLPADKVQVGVDPHAAGAPGPSTPRVRLAPSAVPEAGTIRRDTNASETRRILFRYANPEEAASRGMILEAEVPLYSSFRTLFFDRDFGRVLEEGDGELEEQRARGEDYGVSLKSRFLRLRMAQGLPLEGYSNEEDRVREQETEWGELLGDPIDEVNLDRFGQDPPPDGVEVLFFSGAILQREFNRRTVQDLYWAGASMAFVFAYTWFHTGSIVLAAAGLFIIFSAMPIGMFLYRIVFQIPFMQTLHGLAIFVLLGLSADAVFLVQDSYQQAPSVGAKEVEKLLHRRDSVRWVRANSKGGLRPAMTPAALEQFNAQDQHKEARQARAEEEAMLARIAYTWGRASVSLTVTTMTTIVAFLATAGSRIMPISTFGIFAATIVFVNYCLALTLYPSAIVLWERNVRPCEASWARACCGSCCGAEEEAAGSGGDEAAAAAEGEEGGPEGAPSQGTKRESESSKASGNSPREVVADVHDEKAAASAAHAEDGSEVTGHEEHPDANGLVALAGLQTSKGHGHADAEANRPIEVFFRDYWSEWIYVARFPVLIGFAILVGVFAYLASRLGPLTQQEQWFPENFYGGAGLAWLEDEFQLTERDSTVEVDITWGVAGINRDGTSRYKPANPGRAEWDESFDMSSPAAQQAILDTCFLAPAALGRVPKNEELPLYKANVSCFMQEYADWLRDEQGGSFPFVAQGGGAAPTAEEQRTQFLASLDSFTTESSVGQGLRASNRIGFDAGGTLRMVQVAFSLNLEQFEPYNVNKPVQDRLDDFVADRNRASPDGADGAFQTAGISWGWMQTERELLRTAINGMAISLAVATLVLVFSTTNVIVGGLAALSMAGILVVVLGTFGALGWEMGVTESVASVILLGFSVDYTVHSAVHFVTSNKPKAHLRVKDSLRDMGVSIIAGAITTGGAGVFLWGGIIIFFTKFAITLTVAIGASLIFSLAFLPAALCVVGPDGDTGSILPAMRAIGLGCLFESEEEEDGDKLDKEGGGVQVQGAEGKAASTAPTQAETA